MKTHKLRAVIFSAMLSIGYAAADRVEAACQDIVGNGIGRTQDDAMSQMREALSADRQRYPAYQNATCQPARVGCKQDANGFRCTARQTCCRGEAPTTGGSGKVCKRIKFVATAKTDSNVAQTRQVISGQALWGLAAESSKVQRQFGLTHCEQAKVDCVNPTGNLGDDVCTATSRCCNR